MILGPVCILAGAVLAALLVVSPDPILGIPGVIVCVVLLIGGWDILQRSRRLRALSRRRGARAGYVR